jgi:hypothetical protein
MKAMTIDREFHYVSTQDCGLLHALFTEVSPVVLNVDGASFRHSSLQSTRSLVSQLHKASEHIYDLSCLPYYRIIETQFEQRSVPLEAMSAD